MNLETLRAYCLSLPYVAENVQWDEHLVFRIALAPAKSKSKNAAPQGKIFCIANLGPEGACVSFKSTPETFAELVEMPYITPAAYLARSHWVSLERWEALTTEELRQHIGHSYDLVWEKLPKRTREELIAGATAKRMAGAVTRTKNKSRAKAKQKKRNPRKKTPVKSR